MDNWELLLAHMQLYRGFMADADTRLGKLKLGMKDFFVFRALLLYRHPTDIADYLVLPRPTVTFLIKRLEKRGYVKRRSVAGDLRKCEIVMTPKGRKAYEAARIVMTETFEARVAGVRAADMKTYAKVISQFCAEDPAGRPAARSPSARSAA